MASQMPQWDIQHWWMHPTRGQGTGAEPYTSSCNVSHCQCHCPWFSSQWRETVCLQKGSLDWRDPRGMSKGNLQHWPLHWDAISTALSFFKTPTEVCMCTWNPTNQPDIQPRDFLRLWYSNGHQIQKVPKWLFFYLYFGQRLIKPLVGASDI